MMKVQYMTQDSYGEFHYVFAVVVHCPLCKGFHRVSFGNSASRKEAINNNDINELLVLACKKQ